jgi:hypothetical protein
LRNNYKDVAMCFLIDLQSGSIEEVRVESRGVVDVQRKIKPSHGRNMTGRFPMRYSDGGRTESIPCESRLEMRFLEWLQSTNSIRRVKAQPFLARGFIRGTWREYTPDFRIDFSDVPRALKSKGFGPTTIVEVKPKSKATDRDVLLKLCLLRIATRSPVVLVTEEMISTPLERQEVPIVH